MGSPIQIVKLSGDNRFELDLKALSDILLKDSIRDKPVVVVSIVGDFRKGKSFMLNFFLRYLRSGCSDDWLDDTQIPMKGFTWRSGCERETTGIFIWSEPFILELADGKEVAIFLMDTQGINDSQTTTANSAIVFGLSTLISSVQIFNLMHNLQEDNLQVLEYFTEYGRLALDNNLKKPFQKLIILVRDWSWTNKHPFGEEGGDSLLNEFLKSREMSAMRKRIRSLFSEIGGFLLPEPGKKARRDDNYFDGQVCDIDQEFIEYLKIFVPYVFDLEKIKIKIIAGREVKAKYLIDILEEYFKILKSESMQQPMGLYDSNVKLQYMMAFESAIQKYSTEMEKLYGNDKPYSGSFEAKHEELKLEAINDFKKTLKWRSSEYNQEYECKIEDKIREIHDSYKTKNDKKNNTWKDIGVAGVVSVSGAIIHNTFPASGIVPMAFKAAATGVTYGALVKGIEFVKDKFSKKEEIINKIN